MFLSSEDTIRVGINGALEETFQVRERAEPGDKQNQPERTKWAKAKVAFTDCPRVSPEQTSEPQGTRWE